MLGRLYAPNVTQSSCYSTAKESEADFRVIPFTDAWYLGAAMHAFLNKKIAPPVYCRRPQTITSVSIHLWILTDCSTRFGTLQIFGQCVSRASNAKKGLRLTPEFKFSKLCQGPTRTYPGSNSLDRSRILGGSSANEK
jgi:hypothetical protein